MAKFRIKEFDYGKHKSYVVQRKSIFGFWYNPDNIDACATGSYDSLEEAKEMLDQKLTKVTSKIIKT